MLRQWKDGHNVYIVGAGFSRDAGFPLMWDFLNQMHDAYDWLRKNNFLAEAKAIQKVLAFQREADAGVNRVALDIENIEDIFSIASAHRYSGSRDLNDDFSLAIAGTIEAAAQRHHRIRVTASYDPIGQNDRFRATCGFHR
jgi:hypothetical protein